MNENKGIASDSTTVLCEVCNSKVPKYKCPECEIRTCCLTCINIHKKELECEGIRKIAAYKPIEKFTSLDLTNDYRFLESTSYALKKFNKDIGKRYTRIRVPLPLHLHKLRSAAYKKKIRLLYLPQHFSRHRENTTYFNWKTNELFWRIEWVFPNTTTWPETVKFVDERVPDTAKLGTFLSNYIEPDEHGKEMDSRLDFYYASGYSGVTVMLKSNTKPDRFHILDPDFSIRRNLRNKTIIEFPIIYVVLEHHKDAYGAMYSDEESEDYDEEEEVDEELKIEKEDGELSEAEDNME